MCTRRGTYTVTSVDEIVGKLRIMNKKIRLFKNCIRLRFVQI